MVDFHGVCLIERSDLCGRIGFHIYGELVTIATEITHRVQCTGHAEGFTTKYQGKS